MFASAEVQFPATAVKALLHKILPYAGFSHDITSDTKHYVCIKEKIKVTKLKITRAPNTGDRLTSLLDKHCPVLKVRHRTKQSAPWTWFDADCCEARRRTKRAEC